MTNPIACFQCAGVGLIDVAVCCENFESGVCCGYNDFEEQPCSRCDGTGIEPEEPTKGHPMTTPTDRIDEPGVMGAGCGASPMPTEREAWMAKYVLRMLEYGIHADDAWLHCRAVEDSHDYSSDPAEAADAELDCWTDDGDMA